VQAEAGTTASGTPAAPGKRGPGLGSRISRGDGVTHDPPEHPGSPSFDALCADVAAYYTARLARHGAIPLGVDWSCAATQQLRFVKLLRVCDVGQPFSVNDLGCGYGALAAFLAEIHPALATDYLGIDLSPAMIRRARRRFRGNQNTRFVVGRTPPRIADYSIASGIMNVKLTQPVELWEDYVRAILTDMHRASRRGFAVNFMTRPTPGAPADQLYCPAPARWRGFCADGLDCRVELVGDYGLREFTLLAWRREDQR
jgi:SAM-dependent methyltransferase